MKTLKLILLFTFLGLGFMTVDAQRSFAHSIGAEYIIAGNSSNAYGIMYSPRINFLNMGSSTLSVGTHLGLGFSVNTTAFGTGSTFAYDVPFVLEFNLGGGSGSGDEGDFGFYLGGGYGISKITSDDLFNGDNAAKGPIVNAGFRFTYRANPAGIRTSLLFDTTDEGSRVFTVGGFYTLAGKDFGDGSDGGGSSKSKSRRRR